MNKVTIENINDAFDRLKGVALKTPLEYSERLSKEYKAEIYLKREDRQIVRSYKIRGAYNKMSMLNSLDKSRGVVTASAGNHAQGVAYSAKKLELKATIFMPTTTPLQKISRVKSFGGTSVIVKLVGHTYDEASLEAHKFCKINKSIYIPPFDDSEVIAGQGTVGREILEQLDKKINIMIVPIGGGGFASGVSSYFKEISPDTLFYGAEPKGSPSMYESFAKKRPVTLEHIDTFVDGAAVKSTGKLTYSILKDTIKKIVLIPEGQICTTMVELYQNEGIIAEPAGALSIAALPNLQAQVKGKTVVCVVSGGNNDILRYPEIMERSLIHQGKKHYFLIKFAQKPGQLREFVDKALGPTDDIVRFEYIKKTSKETGPALVGIELLDRRDYDPLVKRLRDLGIEFTVIKHSDLLYNYLI